MTNLPTHLCSESLKTVKDDVFHKQLISLQKNSEWSGRLILKESTLKGATLFEFFWEKCRGFLGYSDRTDFNIIEPKIIQMGKSFKKEKICREDRNLFLFLTKRADLNSVNFNFHPNFSKLVNQIATDINSIETTKYNQIVDQDEKGNFFEFTEDKSSNKEDSTSNKEGQEGQEKYHSTFIAEILDVNPQVPFPCATSHTSIKLKIKNPIQDELNKDDELTEKPEKKLKNEITLVDQTNLDNGFTIKTILKVGLIAIAAVSAFLAMQYDNTISNQDRPEKKQDINKFDTEIFYGPLYFPNNQSFKVTSFYPKHNYSKIDYNSNYQTLLGILPSGSDLSQINNEDLTIEEVIKGEEKVAFDLKFVKDEKNVLQNELSVAPLKPTNQPFHCRSVKELNNESIDEILKHEKLLKNREEVLKNEEHIEPVKSDDQNFKSKSENEFSEPLQPTAYNVYTLMFGTLGIFGITSALLNFCQNRNNQEIEIEDDMRNADSAEILNKAKDLKNDNLKKNDVPIPIKNNEPSPSDREDDNKTAIIQFLKNILAHLDEYLKNIKYRNSQEGKEFFSNNIKAILQINTLPDTLSDTFAFLKKNPYAAAQIALLCRDQEFKNYTDYSTFRDQENFQRLFKACVTLLNLEDLNTKNLIIDVLNAKNSKDKSETIKAFLETSITLYENGAISKINYIIIFKFFKSSFSEITPCIIKKIIHFSQGSVAHKTLEDIFSIKNIPIYKSLELTQPPPTSVRPSKEEEKKTEGKHFLENLFNMKSDQDRINELFEKFPECILLKKDEVKFEKLTNEILGFLVLDKINFSELSRYLSFLNENKFLEKFLKIYPTGAIKIANACSKIMIGQVKGIYDLGGKCMAPLNSAFILKSIFEIQDENELENFIQLTIKSLVLLFIRTDDLNVFKKIIFIYNQLINSNATNTYRILKSVLKKEYIIEGDDIDSPILEFIYDLINAKISLKDDLDLFVNNKTKSIAKKICEKICFLLNQNESIESPLGKFKDASIVNSILLENITFLSNIEMSLDEEILKFLETSPDSGPKIMEAIFSLFNILDFSANGTIDKGKENEKIYCQNLIKECFNFLEVENSKKTIKELIERCDLNAEESVERSALNIINISIFALIDLTNKYPDNSKYISILEYISNMNEQAIPESLKVKIGQNETLHTFLTNQKGIFNSNPQLINSMENTEKVLTIK
jgi:hypothetical protein